MDFTDFKDQVERAGMTARRCSDIHWQIRADRFTVNYYPTTGTIYRNATSRDADCKAHGPVTRAIALAAPGRPAIQRQQTPNRFESGAQGRSSGHSTSPACRADRQA